MGHIEIEHLEDDILKLTPEKEYLIEDIRTEAKHSEVYCKENKLKYYRAVREG